jgi:hypothetical protein
MLSGVGSCQRSAATFFCHKNLLRSEIEIFFVRDAAIIKALYNGA